MILQNDNSLEGIYLKTVIAENSVMMKEKPRSVKKA